MIYRTKVSVLHNEIIIASFECTKLINIQMFHYTLIPVTTNNHHPQLVQVTCWLLVHTSIYFRSSRLFLFALILCMYCKVLNQLINQLECSKLFMLSCDLEPIIFKVFQVYFITKVVLNIECETIKKCTLVQLLQTAMRSHDQQQNHLK